MLFTSQLELVPILLTDEQDSRRKRRALILIGNMLNVSNLRQEIKVSFNHSTNTPLFYYEAGLKIIKLYKKRIKGQHKFKDKRKK